MKPFYSFQSRGFSLLELMVALALVTASISAIALLQISLPGSLTLGSQILTATELANALLEKEFILGSESFNAVGSIATSTSVVASTTYSFALTVQDLPDAVTKLLTSSTEWLDAENKAHFVTLTGLVTDAFGAQGNICGDMVLDWTHPMVQSISLTSLGITIPAPIQVLTIFGNTLFAGVTSAQSKTDPTLFAFDISSSTNPLLLGSIDTATSTKTGPAALASDGRYVYSANSYPSDFTTCAQGPTCSQIQILDAATPAHLQSVQNFQLATATVPYASGTGGQSSGKSLFYTNGLLYLGLEKTATSGEEFNIVDVHDPTHPRWLGGYAVGRTVNHIEVSNGYAYLATDNPSEELLLLDVHNPTHIAVAGSYDAPGLSNFGYGEALAHSPSTLLLGRSYTPSGPQLFTLSLAPEFSTQPIFESSSSLSATTASIQSLAFEGSTAAVLSTADLELWNITDAVHPFLHTPVIPLPGSGAVVGNASLACKDGVLYIASSDSSGHGYLTIVSTPITP